VAEKIRLVIEQTPLELIGTSVPVTVSLGGAAARDGVPAYDVLINEADAALYSAKRQGRNRAIAFRLAGA
jgi:diguanylate cyclase (GGDEF)-like protein